ncbi:hypothetical protein [Streptomyces roseicoloratus]|uniref:hypothetical protein n=1 Tax=Streptomyces roseicoloratus TaxID=2508722 RepID=UPI0013E94AC4|nr:hypothetical protein [Streptomyces roseicoloratus]
MPHYGLALFILGALGLLVSTKGRRGWENWGTAGRWGASVSFLAILVGLYAMDWAAA